MSDVEEQGRPTKGMDGSNEVLVRYIPLLEKHGLVFSGFSADESNLVEFIELPEERHIFFIGTQAHPEFKSRPVKPHPLYTEFIKKSIVYQKIKNQK